MVRKNQIRPASDRFVHHFGCHVEADQGFPYLLVGIAQDQAGVILVLLPDEGNPLF